MSCNPKDINLSDSNNSYKNISDIVIFVGVVLLTMTTGISNTYEGMYGHIIAYGFLATGFIVKAGTLVKGLNCSENKLTYFLYSILPFIIVALIIIMSMLLLYGYFNRIVGGKVASDFSTFSRMFIVVIIAQLVIFYNGTQSKDYKEKGILSSAYGMSIYLFSLINVLILISLYIILAFYTTDG
jgi:hypothetical protein